MDFIEIGAIVKPQGIKGELKVKPLADDISAIAEQKTVFMEDKGQYKPYAVLHVRTDKEFAYMLLQGISDRNEAEEVRNRLLFVKREALPLPEGMHYITDLIGMAVYGDSGNMLGMLKDVIVTGAADVYVVTNQKGGFMFPALKRVIQSVDIKQNKMTLDEKALSEVAVYEV